MLQKAILPFEELSRMSPDEAIVFYNGIMGDYAVSDDGYVWYKLWTENDRTYVILHNYSSVEQNISLTANGAAVKLISGAKTSGFCFEKNVLEAEIPADSIVLCEILNQMNFGIYKDNILLTRLEKGTCTLKNPPHNKKIYVVLYTYDDYILKLENCFTDTIVINTDEKQILKVYVWDNLSPSGEVILIKN